MTFVNAALGLIIVLMLLIIVLLLDLKRYLEVVMERIQHIDDMVTEHRGRQRSVASKDGPRAAQVDARPKVKQRYAVPGTGKITKAAKLVRKGGEERADAENSRLRANPDQVHEAKRKARWVGGTHPPESG